jgi:hypothetical protein
MLRLVSLLATDGLTVGAGCCPRAGCGNGATLARERGTGMQLARLVIGSPALGGRDDNGSQFWVFPDTQLRSSIS